MIDLVKLKAANVARWTAMHVEPALGATFDRVAARLTAPAAKARYEIVTAQTGVRRFVVAVIHEREASQSWAANLAQGDPWNAVSVHVPKAGAVRELGKARRSMRLSAVRPMPRIGPTGRSAAR